MKKETLFFGENKLRNKIFRTIGFILSIVSFGYVFINHYDYFFENKYYRNRKILLKLLKDEKIQLKVSEDRKDRYIEFYRFDNYELWVFKKHLEFAVFSDTERDLIGLFTSTKNSKLLVYKILKEINKQIMV